MKVRTITYHLLLQILEIRLLQLYMRYNKYSVGSRAALGLKEERGAFFRDFTAFLCIFWQFIHHFS